jgi:hypothetical protein
LRHEEWQAEGEGRNTKRVLDYGAEDRGDGQDAEAETRMSKKIMGLLRYGNTGKGRAKISVPPLGWRRASEIAHLLRLSASDVLRIARTSFDWRGKARFEYEDIHELDPKLRPVHNTASRERT